MIAQGISAENAGRLKSAASSLGVTRKGQINHSNNQLIKQSINQSNFQLSKLDH